MAFLNNKFFARCPHCSTFMEELKELFFCKACGMCIMKHNNEIKHSGELNNDS